MNEENIATRLKLFIETVGLSNSQFADKCGIPRPTLSQILTGRNKKVSDLLMSQIHNAFPELSVLWLMFGEGEMMQNGALTGLQNGESQNLLGDNSGDPNSLDSQGLEIAQNLGLSADNKQVRGEKSWQKLSAEKGNSSQNPRKVTQITVYYDDSTFETFYPKR